MLKDEEAVGFVKVVGSFPLFFWAWSATLFFGEGEKRMNNIHHKEH